MSIRKMAVKLAAAAVAAAGVVGTAAADDISKGPVDMGVSFLIEQNDTARIEAVVKKSPTRDNLVSTGWNWNKVDGDIGTLGILKVTTNHDGWDIKMKTLYGGKLVNVGKSEEDPNNPVCPSGTTELHSGWNNGKCSPDGGTTVVDKVPGIKIGKTKSLCYNGNTLGASGGDGLGVINGDDNDTVQLLVAIGFCDLGADVSTAATPTAFYSWGAPDEVSKYPAVVIDSATLKATRKFEADGSAAGTPNDEVSFATVIGTTYSTQTPPPGLPLNGQEKGSWSGLGGGACFKMPLTPETNNHVQHFYVNVGINPGSTTKNGTPTVGFLEKKENNGTYEETFTFELTTNY